MRVLVHTCVCVCVCVCVCGRSVGKNLPTVQQLQVPSRDQQDPLRRKWHVLQYPCLGNPMDRGAWWATVCWVSESTQLSN